VAQDALGDEAPFDAVLCRNLWVYLTPAARARLEALLARLVGSAGVLFMGHAEAPTGPTFERVGPASAFMFRKASEGRRAPAPATRRTPAHGTVVMPKVTSGATPPHPAPAPPPGPSLEGARRLADAGDLERAAAECERVLRERGHDAETYALLGTIENARGRGDAAIKAWQRAVYLDPEHRTALLQLALAWRERGEAARAEVLIERAGRKERS
jgi:chemotaxis protein methyltransferase WspC